MLGSSRIRACVKNCSKISYLFRKKNKKHNYVEFLFCIHYIIIGNFRKDKLK